MDGVFFVARHVFEDEMQADVEVAVVDFALEVGGEDAGGEVDVPSWPLRCFWQLATSAAAACGELSLSLK